MSTYSAKIQWQRGQDNFLSNQYSRGHQWHFDGGFTVEASSSPHIVPLPLSVEENVDPEEAFVASLSSCHMLFFLSIAAKKKIIIEEYIDEATGWLEKGLDGKLAMTRVELCPKIRVSSPVSPDQINKIHHLAHESCFIANSVKTEVYVSETEIFVNEAKISE